jgi:hypothetical protein
MLAIQVVFNERGYWSKPYTYKYEKEPSISKGDIVVVPVNDFYSVGKVLDVINDYNFKDNINYKHIVQKLQL